MAFVVAPDDIERLDRILGTTGVPPKYDVALGDGMRLRSQSLEEVRRLENSSRRRIVEIAASSESGDRAVEVRLRERPLFETVSYQLRGQPKDTVYLADQLDEWISGVRPWYSRLACTDMVVFLILTVFVLIGALLIVQLALTLTGHVEVTSEDSLDPRSRAIGNLVGALIWFVPFALGAVANVLRGWLFPVGAFRIGSGAKRYQRVSQVRKAIGVTFVLSVVGGVVANLITT